MACQRREDLMHFHATEAARKGHVLLGGQGLIMEKQHQVFVQRALQAREQRVVDAREVDARHIGANRRSARLDVEYRISHHSHSRRVARVFNRSSVRVPARGSR